MDKTNLFVAFVLFQCCLVGLIHCKSVKGNKELASGVNAGAFFEIMSATSPFRISYTINIMDASDFPGVNMNILLVDDSGFTKVKALDWANVKAIEGVSATSVTANRIEDFDLEGDTQYHLVIINNNQLKSIVVDYEVVIESTVSNLSTAVIVLIVVLVTLFVVAAVAGVIAIVYFMKKKKQEQQTDFSVPPNAKRLTVPYEQVKASE